MKKHIRRGNPEKRRYWEEVVRRWGEDDQSVRAFCRAEGVRESAFYFWRRKLARRGRRTDKRVSPRHGATPSFLPVHVVGSASRCPGVAEADHSVEIILGQGRTVRVQAGFDRQTLADVLAVLEVQPC